MMRHNSRAYAEDLAALAVALGWGAVDGAAFAGRLDAVADATSVRAQLRRVVVPGDAIAPMARDVVAIRRLIDPNPREVTVADRSRIFDSERPQLGRFCWEDVQNKISAQEFSL
jgi:alcohol dehydrogenase class IV